MKISLDRLALLEEDKESNRLYLLDIHNTRFCEFRQMCVLAQPHYQYHPNSKILSRTMLTVYIAKIEEGDLLKSNLDKPLSNYVADFNYFRVEPLANT
jgi:hypothetical protein